MNANISMNDHDTLLSAIEEALAYDVLDYGDTDRIVEIIFDNVSKLLQHDSRFPRLSCADYDLLFADIAHEARIALRPYQLLDHESAAEQICDAVVEATTAESEPQAENLAWSAS
jgi:hypothetical protein